jgi:ketosteroid isomerase-like protein
MTRTPSEVVQQMTAAYNRGDIDAGIALIADDAVDHSPADCPSIGPAAWRDRWIAARAAAPDVVVRVEQVVEQGDMVARRLRISGHRGGQAVDSTGLDMVRVRGGYLVEHWALVRPSIGSGLS